MRKLMVFGIAAALSVGAFAEEIDGHTVLYSFTTGGYWDGGKCWKTSTDSAATLQKWEDDCVAVIYSGNIYLPQNAVCTAYQLKMSGGGFHVHIR